MRNTRVWPLLFSPPSLINSRVCHLWVLYLVGWCRQRRLSLRQPPSGQPALCCYSQTLQRLDWEKRELNWNLTVAEPSGAGAVQAETSKKVHQPVKINKINRQFINKCKHKSRKVCFCFASRKLICAWRGRVDAKLEINKFWVNVRAKKRGRGSKEAKKFVDGVGGERRLRQHLILWMT